MQNRSIRENRVVICKPKQWLRISLYLMLVIFGAVELWMLYSFLTAFSTFGLGFVAVWGGVLIGLIVNYPATVQIYHDGIYISQWGIGRFVMWNDIDFMWENTSHLNPVIVLGSRKFPKHRILAGLTTIFRLKAIYRISSVTHTDYDSAYLLLRKKLGHCYRHYITLRRW